jgi:hypothetical protein
MVIDSINHEGIVISPPQLDLVTKSTAKSLWYGQKSTTW